MPRLGPLGRPDLRQLPLRRQRMNRQMSRHRQVLTLTHGRDLARALASSRTPSGPTRSMSRACSTSASTSPARPIPAAARPAHRPGGSPAASV